MKLKSLTDKIRRLKNKSSGLKGKELAEINKQILISQREKDKIWKSTSSYKKRQENSKVLKKELKNIKSKIYYREKKKQSLDGKDLLKFQKEINQLQNSSRKKSIKIFKKSDQYWKLGSNKRDFHFKVKKLTKLLENDKLDKKEKQKIFEEIKYNSKQEAILDEIMNLPIEKINNKQIKIIEDTEPDGEPDILRPWEMLSEIKKEIESNNYDYIIIYLQGWTLTESTTNILKIELTINQLEKEITDERDKKAGSTPSVEVLYDRERRTIYLNTAQR